MVPKEAGQRSMLNAQFDRIEKKENVDIIVKISVLVSSDNILIFLQMFLQMFGFSSIQFNSVLFI